MAELTLEESIQQILPSLPVPVQNFFKEDRVGETARLLTERYALHVDQGGILEREIIRALLGVRGPDEMAEDLYEKLPISGQTVQDIIKDINQEVFVPLREQMRKGPAASAPTPPPPPPRLVNAGAPSIAPRPVSGTQSSSHFHLENKITPPATGPSQGSVMPKLVPPPRPLNPAPTAPGERSALRDALAAITKTPLPSPKAMEATAKTPSDRMLEDHEEPHIEFHQAAPQQTAPLPPNLPGALPPKVSAPAAPAKPYSSDPYREPIE